MTSRLTGLLAPFALIAPLALAPATALAREPVALNATVSAADPRAAAAGQEILRKGGSATDAAIAMMLALNVVEPHNSGIGGGGFLMHHDGASGVLESIDGRETAPAAARPDRFMGPDGKPLPFVQAWPGGYSVGVPGNLRMAWEAHKKWGKLPWADLFQPAIRLADDGFQLGERTATALKALQNIWADFPEIRSYYWIDGQLPAVGTTLKNPPLAALFKRAGRLLSGRECAGDRQGGHHCAAEPGADDDRRPGQLPGQGPQAGVRPLSRLYGVRHGPGVGRRHHRAAGAGHGRALPAGAVGQG